MLATLELNTSHNPLYDSTLRTPKNRIDSFREARMIKRFDRIMWYLKGH
jgi:hypothetical protein